MAMMDLGMVYTASSFLDDNWNNGRLDSRTGFHNHHQSTDGKPYWNNVDFGGDKKTVRGIVLMKRADS